MRRETVKKMTVMAMLMALSVVLISAVHTPLLPSVSFLEYDPGDVPILIGTMAYGPVAGLVLTVVAALIQGTFISTTGPWGIVMHIIGTGSMVLAAGCVYKVRRTKGGAVLGLVLATLVRALVMIPANHFITPIWMGAPVEVVDSLMLSGIVPVNLIKAAINSGITFVVYKAVSRYLVHGDPFAAKAKKEPADVSDAS